MRRDRGAGRLPHRVTMVGCLLVLAVAIAAALGTASTGSSATGRGGCVRHAAEEWLRATRRVP